MRFLCFSCCFRTTRLRNFSNGFRRCFRSRVCIRILRFSVGRIILTAAVIFGRCLRFRHRFLHGDIAADPIHRVQFICRLDVVNCLIGSRHTGGKVRLVRVLCFIEVHLNLILVQDLQVGEILFQVDFRIEIHLVIFCRDNLFRIQLVLHLVQLRQSFHIGLQFLLRIHLRCEGRDRSHRGLQHHHCREQSGNHSCRKAFLLHSFIVPFMSIVILPCHPAVPSPKSSWGRSSFPDRLQPLLPLTPEKRVGREPSGIKKMPEEAVFFRQSPRCIFMAVLPATILYSCGL